MFEQFIGWVAALDKGVVFSAILGCGGAIGAAVIGRKKPEPTTSMAVRPTTELTHQFDRLDRNVADIMQAVGELGGKITMVHEASRAISPLGERVAALESAHEDITAIREKFEDIRLEMHKIKHNVAGVAQAQQFMAEKIYPNSSVIKKGSFE